MNTTINKKYFIHFFKPINDRKDFEFISLEKIDNIEACSIESIYIHDLLDYIEEKDLNKTIRILKSKLIDGGKLYIQGTDIKSASAALLYGQINTIVYKSMIYGIGKKSTYTTSDIKELLLEIDGLKILSINYINASQYYIECVLYE